MKKYIVDGVGKVVVTETETDDMVDTVGSMVDERVTGSKDIPKSMQNTDNTKQCVERSSSDMQRDTDLDPSGPITTLLLTSEGGNCSSSKNAFRVTSFY